MTEPEGGSKFGEYWRGVRRRTRRLLPLVPDGRLEWSPAPGRWSFGDLFRHLAAIERWMYAENVRGLPSRYPGHGPELASGLVAVGTLMDRWHEESCAVFASLGPDRLAARCVAPAGPPLPSPSGFGPWSSTRPTIEARST
jgi:hypothetical protein